MNHAPEGTERRTRAASDVKVMAVTLGDGGGPDGGQGGRSGHDPPRKPLIPR